MWLLPGGACMVAGGVCGYSQGGMCGCSLGECMVAPGGHTWLLWGACMVAPRGHAWLLRGVCMVAPGEGGMHGCSGGACVVAPGGHAWLLLGGMRDCSGGMRGIRRDTEIRSMSGRYASYWNAFLFFFNFRIFFCSKPQELNIHAFLIFLLNLKTSEAFSFRN